MGFLVILCTLFYTFLKLYSKKGSVSFHRLPKGSVAWKNVKTPWQALKCQKVQGQPRLVPPVRPEAREHGEGPRLCWSPLPRPLANHSRGTTFPGFLLTHFRGKEQRKSVSGAGRGCSRFAQSRLREAVHLRSPDRIFSHLQPPTPRLPRGTRRHRPWQPLHTPGPDRAMGNLGRLNNSLSFQTPPFSVLSTGMGDAGSLPLRNGTQISTRGRWVCRCEESPPAFLLPKMMCLERNIGGDQPALHSLVFFSLCLSIPLSAYLALSLTSLSFFFFSLFVPFLPECLSRCYF